MEQIEDFARAVKQLNDNIQCPICHDSLVDPITTNCNHHYCMKCHKKLFRTGGKKNCPVCQAPLSRRSCSKYSTSLNSIVEAVKLVIQSVIEDTGIDFSKEASMPVSSREATHSATNTFRGLIVNEAQLKKQKNIISSGQKDHRHKHHAVVKEDDNIEILSDRHPDQCLGKEIEYEDPTMFPTKSVFKKVTVERQLEAEPSCSKVSSWLEENKNNLNDFDELSIFDGSLPKKITVDLNTSYSDDDLVSVSQNTFSKECSNPQDNDREITFNSKKTINRPESQRKDPNKCISTGHKTVSGKKLRKYATLNKKYLRKSKYYCGLNVSHLSKEYDEKKKSNAPPVHNSLGAPIYSANESLVNNTFVDKFYLNKVHGFKEDEHNAEILNKKNITETEKVESLNRSEPNMQNYLVHSSGWSRVHNFKKELADFKKPPIIRHSLNKIRKGKSKQLYEDLKAKVKVLKSVDSHESLFSPMCGQSEDFADKKLESNSCSPEEPVKCLYLSQSEERAKIMNEVVRSLEQSLKTPEKIGNSFDQESDINMNGFSEEHMKNNLADIGFLQQIIPENLPKQKSNTCIQRYFTDEKDLGNSILYSNPECSIQKQHSLDIPLVKTSEGLDESKDNVLFLKMGNFENVCQQPSVKFWFLGSCMRKAEKEFDDTHWLIKVSKTSPICDCGKLKLENSSEGNTMDFFTKMTELQKVKPASKNNQSDAHVSRKIFHDSESGESYCKLISVRNGEVVEKIIPSTENRKLLSVVNLDKKNASSKTQNNDIPFKEVKEVIKRKIISDNDLDLQENPTSGNERMAFQKPISSSNENPIKRPCFKSYCVGLQDIDKIPSPEIRHPVDLHEAGTEDVNDLNTINTPDLLQKEMSDISKEWMYDMPFVQNLKRVKKNIFPDNEDSVAEVMSIKADSLSKSPEYEFQEESIKFNESPSTKNYVDKILDESKESDDDVCEVINDEDTTENQRLSVVGQLAVVSHDFPSKIILPHTSYSKENQSDKSLSIATSNIPQESKSSDDCEKSLLDKSLIPPVTTNLDNSENLKFKEKEECKTNIQIEGNQIRESENTRMVFVCSGLPPNVTAKVKRFALMGRIGFSDTFCNEMTHLIVAVDKNSSTPKTLKYLKAVAAKKWIVSYDWIVACAVARKLVPEEEFEAKDTLGVDGPRRSRLSCERLFKSIQVCFIEPFNCITLFDLQALFIECGGIVSNSPEKFSESHVNVIRIIVTDMECDDMNSLCQKWLTRHQAVAVISDWVCDCIGTFKLQSLVPYLATSYSLDQLRACKIAEELLHVEGLELNTSCDISE